MIHRYKNNGYNIVMDISSGSVHVVDDIVYEVIPLAQQLVSAGIRDVDTVTIAVETLQELPFSHREVTEAVGEVISLAERGILFAEDPIVHPVQEQIHLHQHSDQVFARQVMTIAEQVRQKVCAEAHKACHAEELQHVNYYGEAALELIAELKQKGSEREPDFQKGCESDVLSGKTMPEKCRKCFARYYCSGDRFQNEGGYDESQSIHEPECERYKKCVEYASMIKAALADEDK